MLIIIGSLNWGFVGIFNLDVVAELLGGRESILSRLVYSLVGLSAVYIIYESLRGKK
jgi:uncharacterized membrane protein YuzA (DUF378 family)